MLIYNVDKPTTYSEFCIKCHFDNEEVTNPKYFTFCFKNQYFRKCISNASGGTNIQNLNQEILSKHKVQLPPLPTQQKNRLNTISLRQPHTKLQKADRSPANTNQQINSIILKDKKSE